MLTHLITTGTFETFLPLTLSLRPQSIYASALTLHTYDYLICIYILLMQMTYNRNYCWRLLKTVQDVAPDQRSLANCCGMQCTGRTSTFYA